MRTVIVIEANDKRWNETVEARSAFYAAVNNFKGKVETEVAVFFEQGEFDIHTQDEQPREVRGA